MNSKIIIAVVIVVLAIAACAVNVATASGTGATVGAAAKTYMEAYNEQKDISYENMRDEAYNIAFDLQYTKVLTSIFFYLTYFTF